MSPSDSAFHFPNGRFQLNENYGIGDETEINIPFADMRHLLKPGSGFFPN